MNEGKGSILNQISKNPMSISLLTHLSWFLFDSRNAKAVEVR